MVAGLSLPSKATGFDILTFASHSTPFPRRLGQFLTPYLLTMQFLWREESCTCYRPSCSKMGPIRAGPHSMVCFYGMYTLEETPPRA